MDQSSREKSIFVVQASRLPRLSKAGETPAPQWSSLFAILLLVLGAFGCAGPAPASEFIRQAEKLHRESLAGAVPADPDLTEYFHVVGQRLMTGAKAAAPERTRAPIWSQFQTHLVSCDVINVYTTGGVHVYAYNGLFQSARTEEELAAAIAHALAHAIRLDLEQAGLRPNSNRALRAIAWDFVQNRYTPQQQSGADDLAFAIYTRAGWDPRKFALPQRATSVRTPTSDPRWRRPNVADARTFGQLREKARAAGAGITPQSEPIVFLTAFPNCLLPADTPAQRAAQDQLRPAIIQEVPLEPN